MTPHPHPHHTPPADSDSWGSSGSSPTSDSWGSDNADGGSGSGPGGARGYPQRVGSAPPPSPSSGGGGGGLGGMLPGAGAGAGAGGGPGGVYAPYYFNIGSVESFERKLEQVQREMGLAPRDFIPVQYVNETNWAVELVSAGQGQGRAGHGQGQGRALQCSAVCSLPLESTSRCPCLC